MNKISKIYTHVSLLAAFILTASISAKTPTDEKSDVTLFNTLAKHDLDLFAAFNQCDLDKQKLFLDEKIEFYHDKGGLTLSREKLMRSAIERCANKDILLRRELVKESLEAYPIKDFGAVQKGVHHFYLSENGQPEKLVEVAQFVHVWHQSEDGWTITRVLSFDHKKPD